MNRPCVAKSFFCAKNAQLPYECSKFRRTLSSVLTVATWDNINLVKTFCGRKIQLTWLYIYPWEEGIIKDDILVIGYPSPPSGHFGNTSSVKRDPLDLFFFGPSFGFLALLLEHCFCYVLGWDFWFFAKCLMWNTLVNTSQLRWALWSSWPDQWFLVKSYALKQIGIIKYALSA